MPFSFYRGVFIIAPSSLDLGSSFNSFKTVIGRRRLDKNICRLNGATKHVQKVFLTHGHVQSCPDKIADELFCNLLFMAPFDLIKFGIS
jgi:hypothetical protein